MPDFTDFAPLYDFSLIEKAVQQFFVSLASSVPTAVPFVQPADDDDPNRGTWTAPDGTIAFYTAFQNETFQKVRPRIYCQLNNITDIKAYIVDVNNTLRPKAWRATMMFGIVTKPSYNLHTSLRSQIEAIIPQLQPLMTPDGTGVLQGGLNALLTLHEVGAFSVASTSTHIAPEDGTYNSVIPCDIAFNVRATAWPGGVLTQ
jgi:hypothetical protein